MKQILTIKNSEGQISDYIDLDKIERIETFNNKTLNPNMKFSEVGPANYVKFSFSSVTVVMPSKNISIIEEKEAQRVINAWIKWKDYKTSLQTYGVRQGYFIEDEEHADKIFEELKVIPGILIEN